MKKILSILTILIISLSLAACNRSANEEPSPEITDTEEQTNTNTGANEADEVVPVENLVLIENGKFSPQKMTVAQGTTITWTNKEEDKHWIISDPHPTHSDLPELDSGEALLQNETYQFTFDKIGEWNYHDKLNTTITGTVVVE